jgi:hypothetical protein
MRRPKGAVRCNLIEHSLVTSWHCQWLDKDGQEIARSEKFKTEDEARTHAALAGFTQDIPLDDD